MAENHEKEVESKTMPENIDMNSDKETDKKVDSYSGTKRIHS